MPYKPPQAALDDEMERRRKRVEEWRAKKAAEQAAAEAAKAAAVAEAADAAAAAAVAQQPQGKGWSLEDDDDDEEEEGPQQQAADGQPGAEEEVDPLDAFMAGNEETGGLPSARGPDIMVVDAAANGGAGADDDEVDPLDAFMSAEIMPEVAKVSSVCMRATRHVRCGGCVGVSCAAPKHCMQMRMRGGMHALVQITWVITHWTCLPALPRVTRSPRGMLS